MVIMASSEQRSQKELSMERMLPETGLRLSRIQSGADSMMELSAEAF